MCGGTELGLPRFILMESFVVIPHEHKECLAVGEEPFSRDLSPLTGASKFSARAEFDDSDPFPPAKWMKRFIYELCAKNEQ